MTVCVTIFSGAVLVPSVTTSAPTVIVISDPPCGVITKLYVSPLPVNSPFAPPVTLTSGVSNPVTTSEKVNVAVRLAVEELKVPGPLIESVGLEASQTAVAETGILGPIIVASSAAVAEFAATSTVRSIPWVGVTIT